MSDPSALLWPAIAAALRADAGVKAAFAPSRVKVYDVPPPDARPPYIVLESASIAPEFGECMDNAEAEVTVCVYALADPPSRLAAMQIGPAVQAALLGLEPPLGLALSTAVPVRLTYLMEADGKTAKGAIAVRYATNPL